MRLQGLGGVVEGLGQGRETSDDDARVGAEAVRPSGRHVERGARAELA